LQSNMIHNPARELRLEQLKAMFKLSRPVILQGGILAYSLGAAMGYAAGGVFDAKLAGIGLLITVVANLVAHYTDEYADVDTDSITQRTLFSGGSGVLPSGIVPPVWSLRMAWVLAGLTTLLTAWFIASGMLTWHVAWIVSLGTLGGWLYSMPPLALERRGLGELDNALLGAFLMPLMGYTVQTGAPTLTAWLNLTPIFSIVMVGLLGVHWADREADAIVGKRSLVVIMGERSRNLHSASAVLTYVLTIALAATSTLPLPVAIAILSTLPVSAWAVVTFTRTTSPFLSGFAIMTTIGMAAVGWIVAAS